MFKRAMAMACCVIWVACSPAFAQNGAPGDAPLVRFKAANAALRDEVAKVGAGGQGPAKSDAAYQTHMSSAFDVGVVDANRGADLLTILDICSEVARTQASYLQSGLKTSDVAGRPSQEAADRMIQLQNQNYLRFQNELTQALKFSLACNALSVTKMLAFVQSLKPGELTDARRGGLAQAQRGLVQMVSGVAIAQTDSISAANRQTILNELVRDIDPLGFAMTKASRSAALANLDRVLAAPGLAADVRAKLATVRSALSRPECAGLCAI